MVVEAAGFEAAGAPLEEPGAAGSEGEIAVGFPAAAGRDESAVAACGTVVPELTGGFELPPKSGAP